MEQRSCKTDLCLRAGGLQQKRRFEFILRGFRIIQLEINLPQQQSSVELLGVYLYARLESVSRASQIAAEFERPPMIECNHRIVRAHLLCLPQIIGGLGVILRFHFEMPQFQESDFRSTVQSQ